MCCAMHPVQLAWAAFAIFLGMPTFNIFQPGVCTRRGWPAPAVGGRCSLTGIGFYSIMHLNICFFYSCVCILCQNSIIVHIIVKKVINHVKTEIRMLYCILPLYHRSSVVWFQTIFMWINMLQLHCNMWFCYYYVSSPAVSAMRYLFGCLNLKPTVVEFIHLSQMNVPDIYWNK